MNQDRYHELSRHFERLVNEDHLTQEKEVAKVAIFDASLAAELMKMLKADRSVNKNLFLNTLPYNGSETTLFETKSARSGQREMVGQYKLQKQLGAGGMGVVYLAFDTMANRSIAIKLVKPELIHDDEMRIRTVNEAHSAAALSHPNIVPIFDVGTVDGEFFFTMPLLESGDLKSSNTFRYRDSETTAELFAQIARGLVHAHERGIIHRDVKPSNIMLDKNGTPMIADFGLAKNLGNQEFQTETGRLMGSANYMSPEQISDSKNGTELSDVYSFGATLYESLTGNPPFSGNDLIEMFQKINNLKPDKPSELNPRVDLRLEAICLRCLEKDPAKRYESMQVVLAELNRVLEGKPLSDRSNIWRSFSDVFGFRRRGSNEFNTQPAAKWVFFHNLVSHTLVWILVVAEFSPIALWILIGCATIHLGLINWHFHWSRYWHLEIAERLSAINLLMANLCFAGLLFIHGPLSINVSVSQFVDAYPTICLIFAITLAAHGGIHAGKWLTYAICFLPLSIVLVHTGIYAPLVFALLSSVATFAIMLDLGTGRKKRKTPSKERLMD